MSNGTALARGRHYLAQAARRTPHRRLPPHRTWSIFPDAQERRLNRLMDEANRRAHDPVVQAAYLRALGKLRPADVVTRVEQRAYAAGESVAKEYIKALVATGAIDRVKLPQLLQTISAEPSAATHHPTSASTATPASAWNTQPPIQHAAPLQAAAAASSSSGPSGGSGPTSGANSTDGSSGGEIPWNAGAAPGAMAAAAAAKGASSADPIHVTLAEPSLQSQLWRAVRVLGSTFLILGFLGVLMEERGMTRGMGINTDMKPEPESTDPTTFDDVKGCDEAKAELEEIVQFLRSPASFTRLGGKLPKGLLLMGPPGTGKTMLARAIAGEAQRPFFYASGSEFEEMFVGVGAKRVRELFAAAKQNAPCIIFIDEIDAIGGKRNPKDQRFLTMTLNQFLVELDGFQSSEGIIVIGATNFPESLDQALVRPGRFDRHVTVPLPDIRGRTEILTQHTKDIPLEDEIDLEIIARGTPGFSGADLANLVNMAALNAAIAGSRMVSTANLEHARDKILMGPERKSAVLSSDTKRLTAYHEGGHALCCLYTQGALPVHKATIMPRGPALGMVMQLPDRDMTSMSRKQMLAKLDVCMGGRAAEELIFGSREVTSGASSDFRQATQLAEAMVTEYGMSEKLGRVTYEKGNASTEVRGIIDAEVRRLLDEAYGRALKLLKEREGELHRLASALLEHETLTGDEMRLAVRGELRSELDGGTSGDGRSGDVDEEVESRQRAGGRSGVVEVKSKTEEKAGSAESKGSVLDTGKAVGDADL